MIIEFISFIILPEENCIMMRKNARNDYFMHMLSWYGCIYSDPRGLIKPASSKGI